MRTLTEAANILGANTATILLQVIFPNIIVAVLSGAFLTLAIVIGEFTIASLLHFDTLPVVLVLLQKSDAPASMAAALGSIVFAALLLVGLSLLDRRRPAPGGTR